VNDSVSKCGPELGLVCEGGQSGFEASTLIEELGL